MDEKKNENKTSPKVSKGVEQQQLINEQAAQSLIRRKKKNPSIDDFITGILKGNRVLLGQAITILESTKESDAALGHQLIDRCLPHAGKSIRIGVTGAPGVGKSTFIESFGNYLLSQNRKLATLAIDPTSQISRGSILGDKTRMEKLSAQANAFIRPSPAGKSLGGVARKTREAIVLCEAAGFDTIIIETVGVGQSEIAVHSMVDLFLLLLSPGGGDELQGIKRGIVEMADLVIVNKSDGDRAQLAKQTRSDYYNALHLYPPKESAWTPQVVNCSALEQEGITAIWGNIEEFYAFTNKNAYFEKHRKEQSRFWLYETIQNNLQQRFFDNPTIQVQLTTIEKAVLEGTMSPFKGAEVLLDLFKT